MFSFFPSVSNLPAEPYFHLLIKSISYIIINENSADQMWIQFGQLLSPLMRLTQTQTLHVSCPTWYAAGRVKFNIFPQTNIAIKHRQYWTLDDGDMLPAYKDSFHFLSQT